MSLHDDINNNPASFLVSVHMIVYNHEPYIKEAIEGVLMQQVNFGLELIIANDASTDQTDAVIKRIIGNHPKAHLIRYFNPEKNLGMMPNFIFALNECKGKYIAFCEGDDYWTDPLKLQKQAEALEAGPAYSMVISNRQVLQEDQQMMNEYYDRDLKKNVFTITDIINGFIPGMQTILMRKYESLPVYLAAHPEFYYADRYICYFCSLFGNILLIPDITAVYRLTGSGAWSVNTPLQKLHKFTKFMGDFHASLGMPANNARLAQLEFDSAYTTLRYCLKRPGLFKNKEYRQAITQPWGKYKKMNRVKIFLSEIFNRKK